MKKVISTLCLLGCMALTSQAMAATVALDPANQSFPVGTTRDVNVVMTLDSGEELWGFDFDLTFDNAILGYAGFIWGAIGTDPLYLVGYDGPGGVNPDNLITFNGVYFGDPLAGDPPPITGSQSFTLATLSFTGLTAGTGLLDLTGDIIYNTAAPLLTVSAQGSMNPVPEPATLLLLSTGIAGFAGIRRKSRKA